MDWVLIFISNLGIFKRHNLRMKRWKEEKDYIYFSAIHK
jgi:hypothetical protein